LLTSGKKLIFHRKNVLSNIVFFRKKIHFAAYSKMSWTTQTTTVNMTIITMVTVVTAILTLINDSVSDTAVPGAQQPILLSGSFCGYFLSN